MLHELANTTPDTGSAAFAPANHLLGIVQQIVASRDNARIALPGKGEVAIFPGRREYYADVQDLAEFCRAPASLFRVTAFNAADLAYSSGSVGNIKDLLWVCAFHASAGLMPEDCSKYDVVQFRHWPNLTRLPVTQNAARICALLTRHPTTIMLVHRLLGIEKEEVYQIYSAAYSAGIALKIGGHNLELASNEAGVVDAQPEPAKARGLFRSLFAKISGL